MNFKNIKFNVNKFNQLDYLLIAVTYSAILIVVTIFITRNFCIKSYATVDLPQLLREERDYIAANVKDENLVPTINGLRARFDQVIARHQGKYLIFYTKDKLSDAVDLTDTVRHELRKTR